MKPTLSKKALWSALALLTACAPERRLEFQMQDQAPEVRALLNGNLQSAASATGIEKADVSRAAMVLRGDYFEDPSLSRVSRDFGRSKIQIPSSLVRSPVAEARVKPWSSWWYPKFEDTLFSSATGLSPLEKIDLYRDAHFQAKRPEGMGAAPFEKRKQDTRALAWEGMCNAWSLASILAPEPREPRTFRIGKKDVTFSVGDQKALLLKTFEGLSDNEVQVYGQKFTGNDEGWIHPDIFPDQFHRFVEVQLFERKKPFIMDHDAGVEIWNVPVYKANYSMGPVEGMPNAVQVRMWLYSASSTQKSEMDFVGTKETIREYHYILFGEPMPDGTLEINSGIWIKGPNGIDSRKDHPDYFLTVSESALAARQSFNPYVQADLVDRILRGDAP
jgi:hypothetical protein